MAEYIEREALPKKRTIGFILQDEYFNAGWNACVSKLTEIPVADVREVVYCKNCLHFSYDDVEGGWCDEWGKEVGSPNFYCADGDMKEEQT